MHGNWTEQAKLHPREVCFDTSVVSCSRLTSYVNRAEQKISEESIHNNQLSRFKACQKRKAVIVRISWFYKIKNLSVEVLGAEERVPVFVIEELRVSFYLQEISEYTTQLRINKGS